MLAPGKWVSEQVGSFWTRYLYFVGIREQYDRLRRKLEAAEGELAGLRENAAEVTRLRRLLSIAPPEGWTRQGTRIISHRLGPNAALETFLIDKGSASGVSTNTPVVSPEGVVGRVLRFSPSAATVLLITDPNSRIPVLSQKNRTQGILKGQGPKHELILDYVPQGEVVETGEILVTSGLEEIFPKGLPVARVTSIGRSGSSLFQVIHAVPLFAPQKLEEVALLFHTAGATADGAATAESSEPSASGDAAAPAGGPTRSAAASAATPPAAEQAVAAPDAKPAGRHGATTKTKKKKSHQAARPEARPEGR